MGLGCRYLRAQGMTDDELDALAVALVEREQRPERA